MEQNPSWEADWSSASQEILWDLNAGYSSHKSPPPVPILSQIDPFHAPIHVFKIHFNIILPSKSTDSFC
jgi:hypothetical protein